MYRKSDRRPGATVTCEAVIRSGSKVWFYRLAVGSRGPKIKTAIFLHY